MINQPYPGYTAPHGSEDYGPDPREDDDPLYVDTHDYSRDPDWCSVCEKNRGDDSIVEMIDGKARQFCADCWLAWLVKSSYSEIERISRMMYVFGEDFDEAHKHYVDYSLDVLLHDTYERVNGRKLVEVAK